MEEDTEFETIADRIVPVKLEIERDKCIKSDILNVEGQKVRTVIETPDKGVEISVRKGKNEGIKAKRFLELIQDGETPGRAAEAIGTTYKKIKKDLNIRAAAKKLIEENNFPAAARKEMVRAGLNKIFMENVDGGAKEQKLALAAAKQIGADPDVGLTAPPSLIGLTIDMTQIKNVLQNVKPIEGLEDLVIMEGDTEKEEDGDSDDD